MIGRTFAVVGVVVFVVLAAFVGSSSITGDGPAYAQDAAPAAPGGCVPAPGRARAEGSPQNQRGCTPMPTSSPTQTPSAPTPTSTPTLTSTLTPTVTLTPSLPDLTITDFTMAAAVETFAGDATSAETLKINNANTVAPIAANAGVHVYDDMARGIAPSGAATFTTGTGTCVFGVVPGSSPNRIRMDCTITSGISGAAAAVIQVPVTVLSHTRLFNTSTGVLGCLPLGGGCVVVPAAPMGDASSVATVDATNVIAESNETNNQSAINPPSILTVYPYNLVVGTPTQTPASPTAGGTFTYTVTVTNNSVGNMTAPAGWAFGGEVCNDDQGVTPATCASVTLAARVTDVTTSRGATDSCLLYPNRAGNFNDEYLCTMGALAAGQSVTVTVTALDIGASNTVSATFNALNTLDVNTCDTNAQFFTAAPACAAEKATYTGTTFTFNPGTVQNDDRSIAFTMTFSS